MKMVYAVVQGFRDNSEPELVGVYSSLKLAKRVVKEMEEWDVDYSDPEDLVWSNEETAVYIFPKELDE